MEDAELFKAWPKIKRAKDNNILITEKMDGTNACVIVRDGRVIGAQSRRRMITPQDDNYGFATWVYSNLEALAQLGDGYHYGEWVGEGIQKNPHNLEGKHFFLFNTMRPVETLPHTVGGSVQQVKVLYDGPYTDAAVEKAYLDLIADSPDDVTVEGIIVYYYLFKSSFKLTYANPEGKWKSFQ